jgi:bilin biosynthesis protein
MPTSRQATIDGVAYGVYNELCHVGVVRQKPPTPQRQGDTKMATIEFGKPNVEELARIRDVDGLVQALQYKKDWEVRRDAAMALGKIKDERAVQPLEYALVDKAEHVRRSAVKALTSMGMADPAVLKHFLSDESVLVRWETTRALGELGDPRAVEPLLEALEDERVYVRRGAAWALGEIGDARAVGPLTRIARDKGNRISEIAVEALDRIEWRGTARRVL